MNILKIAKIALRVLSSQRSLSEIFVSGDGVSSNEVLPVIGAGAVLEILSGQLFYDQEE